MKKFIVGLVILGLLEISLALYLTEWRSTFWDAIAAKNSIVFLSQIGVFSVVVLLLCFIIGYSGYLVNIATIKWREKLNAVAHSISTLPKHVDNLEQRVQSDIKDYPELMLTLGYGLFKASIYAVVFSVSLCYSFSWTYLAALVAYGILGTWITRKVARPLTSLNYKTQQAEATYRKDLVDKNFVVCIALMGSMAIKQKYLSYVQSFYGQIGVIVPLLLVAPDYFASAMTIGALMKFNSLSNTLLDNLSYGINSFGLYNKLLSCKARLKEIEVI